MIFYFSGTGNSKWVAEQIASCQKTKLMPIGDEINTSCSYHLEPGELLGFVFPVYSWGPPQIVLDFIDKVKVDTLDGRPDYLFFACTCGDDVGYTDRVMKSAFERKGWRLDSCFSVQMPNTYVLLPFFDVDSHDLVQSKLRKAVKKVARINTILGARSNSFALLVTSIPWIKTYLIRPLFNLSLKKVDSKYWVTDDCIECGLCAKACPVHNIEMKNGKPAWKCDGSCVGCLGCYHRCPKHAIQNGKITLKRGQYYHKQN